jgi:glycosyltransferase involved in cell wall biosynthesis
MTSLAIAVPQIGHPSETFVRRHVESLLPGRTVVLTRDASGPSPAWLTRCPVLAATAETGSWRRLVRFVEHARGVSHDAARTQRFLTRHQVEAVMGEYLDFSLRYLEIALRVGARFYAHAHGYDVSERLREPQWQRAYRRLNEADGVITVSRVSRDRLLALGIDAARIHVVPCGVDVPTEAHVRAERRTVHCVAVGRMVAKKAPIMLLDAFRRAHEACPQLRLDYVGGGPLFSAARQFVQSFRLEPLVTLHGWQPAAVVRELLRNGDVFLQHSVLDPETGDEEGLPVAILEAMAEGLPVVATWHSGIPEAVVAGATGELVAEGDVVDMAAQVVRLAVDPDLRRQLGYAGWKRASEHYTWDRERRALLEIMRLPLENR